MGVGGGASLSEIEILYRARFADFVRVATAITGSREAGRDAVQAGFLAAIQRRSQYRGEASVEAWVWRIVVNSALQVRRADRSASSSVPDRPSAPVTIEDGGWELEHVRRAIARLPERQRLTLFLRYYADLDYRAIASVLGVRVGTVAATLNAAHRSVQALLEEVAVGD